MTNKILKIFYRILDCFYLIILSPFKKCFPRKVSWSIIDFMNRTYVSYQRVSPFLFDDIHNLKRWRDHYDRIDLTFFDRYISRAQWLIGKDILDFGCFVGGKAPVFIREGARSVTGLDLSSRGIDVAKELENEHIKFYCAPLEDFKKGREGIFDTVFSYTVFEHLPKDDIPSILENFYACLRVGGTCMIVFNHFFDRYGAHVNNFIYHAHPQLLFPEQDYLSYCDKKLAEEHRQGLMDYYPRGYSFIEGGADCFMTLNKLSSKEFVEMIKASSFQHCQVYPYTRGKLVQLMNRRFPNMRFFETSCVYILKKEEGVK